MYVSKYVCMYVGTYVYVYLSVYIYIYMYIYIHMMHMYTHRELMGIAPPGRRERW